MPDAFAFSAKALSAADILPADEDELLDPHELREAFDPPQDEDLEEEEADDEPQDEDFEEGDDEPQDELLEEGAEDDLGAIPHDEEEDLLVDGAEKPLREPLEAFGAELHELDLDPPPLKLLRPPPPLKLLRPPLLNPPRELAANASCENRKKMTRLVANIVLLKRFI